MTPLGWRILRFTLATLLREETCSLSKVRFHRKAQEEGFDTYSSEYRGHLLRLAEEKIIKLGFTRIYLL